MNQEVPEGLPVVVCRDCGLLFEWEPGGVGVFEARCECGRLVITEDVEGALQLKSRQKSSPSVVEGPREDPGAMEITFMAPARTFVHVTVRKAEP